MHCRVSGCHGGTSRWGRYCPSHKSRDRRHGDPLQESITTAHLKPYLKLVRDRIDKNPEKQLWPKLEQCWDALTGYCRGYVAEYESGRAVVRHHRRACQEVLKLSGAVEPRQAVEIVLAMYLMLDGEPRRFRSDRGFLFQLVRRVRGVSDVNAGTWYDHSTGKTRRAYRELPPKVSASMADLLKEVLGAAGVHFASLERRDEEQRRKVTLELAQTLAEVT